MPNSSNFLLLLPVTAVAVNNSDLTTIHFSSKIDERIMPSLHTSYFDRSVLNYG